MTKHILLSAILFALPILMPAVGPLHAAEPEWKVGLARVKITPEQPVYLAGYASRTRPFEKVTADLYAKALALEDREGHVGVIVTTDLIGLAAAVAEPICERITAKTGLKRCADPYQLLAHSYWPGFGAGPFALGRRVDRRRGTNHRLHAASSRLISRPGGARFEKRTPANLSWGTGVVDFPMNRREFAPKGVIWESTLAALSIVRSRCCGSTAPMASCGPCSWEQARIIPP